MDPVGGINKAAWGAKLHFCPRYGLCPLWLFLSVTKQATWLPGSYVPWTHPPSPHPPVQPPPYI